MKNANQITARQDNETLIRLVHEVEFAQLRLEAAVNKYRFASDTRDGGDEYAELIEAQRQLALHVASWVRSGYRLCRD